MKLNAKKFAIAIWMGAAVSVATQLIADFYLSSIPIDAGRLLMALLYSLLNPALLAALGAVVYLLGEIRDRLPE
jgi:membrane protein DedA with SNARE-associated domain